ncbi:MAG: ABC transporter substrate-binding protein [Limimaricola sp.]|uniref:ABC transporter substrate-binding protein n=1 Tax=Limimaricola sp. TaxID=2211665 RepID=UPI001D9EF209|nr:ABC transporter substrate-binding protein [Limimaricola sp.]MBI1416204.1 ABC transporter substrate-binding protein [Limimaricola sp.]
MNDFRRTLAAFLIGLAIGPAAARAEQVALMVGGVEKQIYLPLIVTQRLGYFSDEGLDVTIESEPAGVEAADEMLAGAVQGVIGFYDHNIELQALGKYTRSVVQLGLAPGEVEMVSTGHPEVQDIADLRGMRLGVTGLGSSTDFLTKYLLITAGLKLSDVTPVPVGAGDTLIAALRQDHIQAAMTTEPTVSRLIAAGDARVLVDLSSLAATRAVLGGPYPAACLYMDAAWIDAHPQTVQRLANALVHGLRYIASHDADQIATLVPDDFYAGDRAMYVAALARGKSMFSVDGRMPPDGPANVQRVLAAVMPGVAGSAVDLTRTFTNAFVDAVPVN